MKTTTVFCLFDSKSTRMPTNKQRLPDGEEEVSADQFVLLCPPLALLPGLLVGAARQEVLEDVAARQHRVACHVVHPPDQTFAPLRDEVFLKTPRGLLLWQVGHGDDGEALHQPAVQPVKVLVPARRWRQRCKVFEAVNQKVRLQLEEMEKIVMKKGKKTNTIVSVIVQ